MQIRFYIVGGIPQKINGAYALADGAARSAVPTSGLPAIDNPVWATNMDYSSNGLFNGVLSSQPAYNPATQAAPIEVAPVLVAGVWTQQWAAPAALTAAQLAALIPQHVSAVQAKIALDNAGLTAQINTYLTTATNAQKIAWATATTFDRNSPTLQAMATALGMTSAQLDALFTAAAAIVV